MQMFLFVILNDDSQLIMNEICHPTGTKLYTSDKFKSELESCPPPTHTHTLKKVFF